MPYYINRLFTSYIIEESAFCPFIQLTTARLQCLYYSHSLIIPLSRGTRLVKRQENRLSGVTALSFESR